MAQGFLPFVFRGGKRKGAGRKPVGERAGVPRRQREEIKRLVPCHVTVKLLAGLPSLRQEKERVVVMRALQGVQEGLGLAVVHYSIQRNHIHLIVEVASREALARGMQGLLVRMARGLNRLWGRRGPVVADRFHSRLLLSPREVWNALVYVLNNVLKHGGRLLALAGLDRFASGWWFGGWREVRAREFGPLTPVAPAMTWLLREGWRRYGLISFRAVPGSGG